MLRNLFTVVGILSVFAVFFFFIRPDWIKQMSSSPTQGSTMGVKVNGRLPLERLAAKETPKDKGSFLMVDPLPNGDDVSSKLVEDIGDDVPSRSTSYLLIVNKTTNSMRYCRLSPMVRKIGLRGTLPNEVKLQEIAGPSGSPYQAIIWMPSAMELPLEFELSVPSAAKS